MTEEIEHSSIPKNHPTPRATDWSTTGVKNMKVYASGLFSGKVPRGALHHTLLTRQERETILSVSVCDKDRLSAFVGHHQHVYMFMC